MLLGTLLCWSAWMFVIVNTDPFTNTPITMFFFYLTLFFALLGTLALLSFALLRYFSHGIVPMYKHVQRSFFIAFASSGFASMLLFLQGSNMLSMWNVLLLLGVILFLALFKLSTLAYKS